MRRLFLLTLLVTAPTCCLGQATQETSIHSNILQEDRKLWVNVPQYYELRKDSFHLVLLFDGNNRTLFDYTAAAKRFLERNAVDLSEFNAPESIVVSIEQKERWNDFADASGSAKFLNFVTNELLPYLRKNYRVQSYTILIGHSLAGRFSINALLQRPDMFSAVIAASPAFPEKSVEDIKNKLDSLGMAGLANDRALYISTTYLKDDGTEAQFREFAEAMNRQFRESAYKNFRFEFGSSDTLGHAKSPYFSIPEGLHFIVPVR
jgi:predicted alpha/beta superfamily hydrolase